MDRSKYMHAYYLANRQTIISKTKAWQQKNRTKSNRLKQAWAKRNPKLVAAKYARWIAKHLPECAAKTRKRRELSRSVEQCDATSSNVLAQLISSCAKMRCSICGKNMPKNDRTIDHVIPLAKGGTGHIGNLQVVHLSCNCSKRCKTPDQLTGQHEMNFAGRGDSRPIREWDTAGPNSTPTAYANN